MRLRTRFVTLVAADAAGALTAAVVVLPFLRPAYRSAPLHATLETACGLIALLAAFLVFGRYRRTARTDDLALTVGLGFLACANLIFSAMPWALFSVDSMRFAAWTSLIGTVAGTFALALSSLLPGRQLWNPGRAAGIPHPIGAHPLLAAQAVCMVFYAVAAVGFARKAERSGDGLLRWFAPAAALAAVGRANYSLFPSLYTQWVYVGDVPRFAAHLLLLGGVVREIGRYQRGVAELAAMEERRRIARELHDGVAQELAFVATQARLFLKSPSSVEIKYLAAAAERALEESRRAIALLAHPAEESLDAAIVQMVEELTSRVGSSARFLVDSDVTAPPQTRETLLRIVREAVTNAHRHGQAKVITVELSNHEGLLLRIADDGQGFDPTAVDDAGGFGLSTMRARARALGGVFSVESQPALGTTVEVVLP